MRWKNIYLSLQRNDRIKAKEVLSNELQVFTAIDEDLLKETTLLLSLKDFRENEKLSWYTDIKTARKILFCAIKGLIEANPLLSDKLQFPRIDSARLRRLMNQSLNWQHLFCKDTKPDHPDIKSLFVDHTCGESSSSRASYQPLQLAQAPGLGGWLEDDEDFVPHHTVSGGPLGATNTSGSGQVPKRSRPVWTSDWVNNVPLNTEEPVGYLGENHASSSYSYDDLPQNVIADLIEGSAVRSMDFHPEQPTLLLVGTNIGDVALWDVVSQERIASEAFMIWDTKPCSLTLQETLANEYTASVNRVIWSPEGTLFGVAYSKHIVHIYSYYGDDDIRKHLEIEAHVGSVNDIAFSHPDKQLCIITCGEDKTIKVWHVIDGSQQYTFTGHEAPVYCVCPHYSNNVHFIFSTSIDGRIKAWLYDGRGSIINYDAPGLYCTRMSDSDDGKSGKGESYLVEWNEREGSIKRMYNGIGRQCLDDVQFDTTKNQFLVAGDEFVIKFWNMNDVNLTMTIDVSGGLPSSPCVRFNKQGTLLAVSTLANSIKILGSEEGLWQPEQSPVQVPVTGTSDAFVSATGTSAGADISAPVINMIGLSNVDGRSLTDTKPRFNDELGNSMIWKLALIKYPCQLCSLRIRDWPLELKIVRLTYTNSGGAILALADNGMHLLCKWYRNAQNMAGKATTDFQPGLWQPASGRVMRHNRREGNPRHAVPCLALTSNDKYIISASGGTVSVFCLATFRTITTFGTPPPAATSLTFFPGDNNIIAIGLEDASIQIYNVQTDEVKAKLTGHEKRVTGLAFSNVLNVLVSSGADAQICVWRLDSWVKKATKFLEIPRRRMQGNTRVQFHRDGTHLLVTHPTHTSVFNTSVLEPVVQWTPEKSIGRTTDAIYSCDHKLIYLSFGDGSLSVFTAMLQLRCRINPSAYLKFKPRRKVYPVVLAAHPSEPNQLAMALDDGAVIIIEPLIPEGKWGDPVETQKFCRV